MDLVISVPKDLEDARKHLHDSLANQGVAFSASSYGTAFESTEAPGPGVLGYHFKIELDGKTLTAILVALSTLSTAYLKSKSSEAITIDVDQQRIEIRGSGDLDRATTLLRQMQSGASSQSTMKALPSAPPPQIGP